MGFENELVFKVKSFVAFMLGITITSLIGSYTVFYLGPMQQKMHTPQVEYQKAIGAIEEKLGKYVREVVVEKVATVDRSSYEKRKYENWSGSFNLAEKSISIKIASRFATEENYRYYLSRARIEELRTTNTSTWILVGLPHCMRFQSGFDETSFRLLKKHGFEDELKEPDLEMMKSDPEYRDKMRGESWLLVYFLIKKWHKEPAELISKQLFEIPSKSELQEYLETFK